MPFDRRLYPKNWDEIAQGVKDFPAPEQGELFAFEEKENPKKRQFKEMEPMKILNLYCGLGGNRRLWGNQHNVTAVEIDEAIAEEYSLQFPNDDVIVADGPQYLLEHIGEGWDFIWSSPPCTTHTRLNVYSQSPRFADMSLYQEIILLESHWFSGLFAVENVFPYYKYLREPSARIGRHAFWTNFPLSPFQVAKRPYRIQHQAISPIYGFDIRHSKIEHKVKALRNLVDPDIGMHVLLCAGGKQS